MAQYHIDNNGDSGECRVTTGTCPYKDNVGHFDTAEEARYAYEQQQAGYDISSLHKSDDSEEDNKPTITFPVDRFHEFQKSIDKANRRLERNGIEERFEYTVTPRTVELQSHGQHYEVDCYDVELSRPNIKLGEYQVAARVEPLEDGELVAMSSPDVELEGWTPESMYCDHCKTKRQRNNVYVLDGDDGSRNVVGSNCLELYTGVKPAGLWALQTDFSEEFDETDAIDNDPDGFIGSGGGVQVEDTNQVLSHAIAVAEMQGGYRRSDDYRGSTRDATMAALNPSNNEEERKFARSMYARAQEVDVDQFKTDLHAALKDNDNDWATNVKKLSSQERVRGKHMGVAVSAVAAVDNYRAKQREKASKKSGFLGQEKEKPFSKDAPTKAKVLNSKTHDSAYGPRTWVRMQTDDGHIVTWRASKSLGFEGGEELELTGGSVKRQNTWNDEDQTDISALKYNVLSDE